MFPGSSLEDLHVHLSLLAYTKSNSMTVWLLALKHVCCTPKSLPTTQ